MIKSLIRVGAAVVAVMLTFTLGAASTNVPLEDDVYDVLARLEAEGVIQSALLSTRPLSRREVARLIMEAERNSSDRSPFIQQLVGTLKDRFRDDLGGGTYMQPEYIKPLDTFYTRYAYSDSASPDLTYNSDGDLYGRGSNGRVGFSSRVELGWAALFINPEAAYSGSEDELDVIMKKAYGVLNIGGMALEVGKDSQWWGPGRHGSILLSNNAEPMRIVKISNPHPVLLPWIFRYLGPFNFTLFATELEKDRYVPEPYLWGMRLVFKPVPYFEAGLQRTAILGGEGRSEDLETWWESFSGMGENPAVDIAGDPEGVEAGDQRVGCDIKLTIPFGFQPLQFYAEGAGEDEAGGLPTKWAYLGGLYLPRLLGVEAAELRVEYANTYIKDLSNVWYNHDIYRTGYTYKGRVIGHHVGTDSRDLFVALTYRLPELNGRIDLTYDWERHSISADTSPKRMEAALGLRLDAGDGLALEGRYGYFWFDDYGDLPDADGRAYLATLEVSYAF